MNKYIRYSLSFVIPIVIFGICLALNNIAPFGNLTITIYDSNVQYPAFFNALKDFHFYSFNLGLGFNFFSTFTYYLMSPLNFLINFFNIYQYNTFYFLIIIIKIGLCGLTMQYFLSHEKNTNDLWSLIFSIIYSLIGYIASYYYNVFWLDGIIFLPIILRGINKIIEKKSPLLYIITLSLSIILSYYTGYMSCIFCLIYFIYKIIETDTYKNKKIIINFIISSLLSALIACVILIPTYYGLRAGKASGFFDPYTTYLKLNSNIKYLMYSFTPGNFQADLVADGFAQNYCTIFVLLTFILSFFNQKINKKTKIATILIIAFYFLCYTFNLFDYSWQFFQKPIWWQHRYSFTLSLFLIIVAYKNLVISQDISLKLSSKILIAAILSILIIISFITFYQTYNVKIFKIILVSFSILLIICYLLLLNLNNKKLLIISFIILELFINTFISINANKKPNYINSGIKVQKRIKKEVQKINDIDPSFYRLELDQSYTSNDGLLFNYYGINYFDSTRNQKVIDFLDYHLGLTVKSHDILKLNKFDPYILSLLNIKYLISSDSLYYYNYIGNKIYLNSQSLSLGFMVDNSLRDIKLNKNNYYDNITNIYNSMLKKDLNLYKEMNNLDVTLVNAYYDKKQKLYFKENTQKDAYAILKFTASDDMFIIPDYHPENLGSKIYINDQEVFSNKSYIFVSKNDKIKIENHFVDVSQQNNLTNIHYILEKEYLDIMQELDKNKLYNIHIHNKHLLEADIKVSNDKKLLFTTIPYEEGMTIKVNGKKQKNILLLNAFVGLELDKGNNHITIDYLPQGLDKGIICSLMGIIITIIFLKLSKKN